MSSFKKKLSALLFFSNILGFGASAADQSYSLKCWVAYVDANGAWAMGAEKTEAESLAVFAQTPGSQVCANYVNSGGNIDQIFASTDVFCKCSTAAAPAPEPTPQPVPTDFTSIFSGIQFFYETSLFNSQGRGLVILGQKAYLNQSKAVAGFKLELQMVQKSQSNKAVLEDCERLALKALFHPKLSLHIVTGQEVAFSSKKGRFTGLIDFLFPSQVVVKVSDENHVRCELK